MNIVKVKYINESNGALSEQEYSYFAEDNLQVGDIITVPVRDTTGRAIVSAVNVPEAEIAAFKHMMKTIPAKKTEVVTLVEAIPEAGIQIKVSQSVDTIEKEDAEILGETNKLESIAENTAVIVIKPETQADIVKLTAEIASLSSYARKRIIARDEDIKPATDDLSLIANLRKAIRTKQDEWCKPIKTHLDAVTLVFKGLITMLDDVDHLNRQKITDYRNEQIKRQQEAEEINRQKEELARKEAAFFNEGEITIDTTPVEAAPVIGKVASDMGTMSTIKVWKWEPVNLSLIPPEYMMLDSAKITKVVKAGVRNIPGIRIFSEDAIRINTR